MTKISGIVSLVMVLLFVSFGICVAQVTNTYIGRSSTSKSKEEAKRDILRWWGSFSDCDSKKIIDTARFEKSYEIELGGQIPVQYHMYGTTSDGGIVKFKVRIDIGNGSIEYRFYDIEHKSTPGVKHKDGGPVLEEKPIKGSMIFAKTWKAYQDQTMSFIHSMENEIVKVVK